MIIPLSVFLPGKFHRQRSLVGYIQSMGQQSQTWLSTIVIITLSNMMSFFFPSLLLPSHTCRVWPVFHSYKWPHSYHFWLCQSNLQSPAPVTLPWVLSLVIKAGFANPCGRPEVPRNFNFLGAALNKWQFACLLNRTIWRMCCSLRGNSLLLSAYVRICSW